MLPTAQLGTTEHHYVSYQQHVLGVFLQKVAGVLINLNSLGDDLSFSRGGRYVSAEMHTFHDVKEKVLPADPILMLRSCIPSRLRILTC